MSKRINSITLLSDPVILPDYMKHLAGKTVFDISTHWLTSGFPWYISTEHKMPDGEHCLVIDAVHIEQINYLSDKVLYMADCWCEADSLAYGSDHEEWCEGYVQSTGNLTKPINATVEAAQPARDTH